MRRIDKLLGGYEGIASDIESFIFAENELEKADVIFVPGNGYPDMAELAANLYSQGFAPLVVPSGRYSITVGRFGGVLKHRDKYDGDYSTEWEFLRDVLIKNGVPEEAVLREDRASYTYENALYSRDALFSAGVAVKKAILCCKNYHAGRSLMYYQTVFPDTEFIVRTVSVDGVTRENWRKSQKGIHEVAAEMERVLVQFSLYM